MRMRPECFAIVCLLALAACSGTAFAERVTNGGFETGDFSRWRAIGSTGHGSVTVTSAPAEVYQGAYAAKLERTNFGGGHALIDNDDRWPGIANGETLTLSFAAKKLSGGSGAYLNLAFVAYNADNSVSYGLIDPGSNWTPITPGAAYTEYTYTGAVPCDASYTRLYLAWQVEDSNGVGSPTAGYALDAISVTVAPEPATTVLLEIGDEGPAALGINGGGGGQ